MLDHFLINYRNSFFYVLAMDGPSDRISEPCDRAEGVTINVKVYGFIKGVSLVSTKTYY